jgi:hypothetical protein
MRETNLTPQVAVQPSRMLRYCLQQDSAGRWVIVSSRDPDLIWQGRHWVVDRDRRGAHLSFADSAAAEQYCEQVFK